MSIAVPHKKKGRPATGSHPTVNVRLSPEVLAKIDAWRERQPGNVTRSDVLREGIAALIKLGGLD